MEGLLAMHLAARKIRQEVIHGIESKKASQFL
jgi:hypothetical protein